MITWIQLRIQKHMRILFMFFLFLVISSFVLTIGNQSFFGSHNDNHFKAKDFYGYNLASEGTKSYLNLFAQISLRLNPEFRYQGLIASDVEEYAHDRAAALSIAKSLGIAEPTDDELRAHVRGMFLFADDKGEFSVARYKEVMEDFARGMRVPESTVLSVISEDCRIEKVRELLGGAGFISPDYIALQGQMSGTEWSFFVARVPLANFNPSIPVDEATLRKFYTDNQARFQIPEKIRVQQIRFPAVSFVAQVPPATAEEIQAVFERNKFRYRPADLKPGADGQMPDFAMDDAIRARVVQDITDMRAQRLASEEADKFTMELMRASVPSDSPRIAELAASMNAQVSPVEPFAKGNPPANSDVRATDLDHLWILANSENYFSDVISSPTGASVFIFLGTIPSRMPAYEEVKVEVEAAYTAERKADLFAAYGRELRAKLSSAVSAGTPFADAAKALSLPVDNYPAIKLQTAPQEISMPGGPMEIALRLNAGSVSPMQINPNGGFLVFLASKNVPAFDSVQGKPEEVDSIRKVVSSQDGWRVVNGLSARRQAELEAEEHGGKEKE